MMKSTIALLAVLFASAASQWSVLYKKQLQHAEELLHRTSEQTSAVLNRKIGSSKVIISELEEEALKHFEPLFEEIIGIIPKVDDGTACANLMRDLEKSLKDTFIFSNKCISQAISKHQPDLITYTLGEVTQAFNDMKYKLSTCRTHPREILCLADVMGEIVSLPIFLETWMADNIRNRDQIFDEFKSSLETCWTKEPPIDFLGKVHEAARDVSSCLNP